MSLQISDSDYPDVRKLRLFSAMSDEHFASITQAAYVQNFPPRLELITEGDPSDFLHIVLSGSVELFSSRKGRVSIMDTVRPGSTFILAAIIKDAPYLMSARTLQKSRIVLIPSEDVRAAFSADSNFARAIVTELAHCYRSVVKKQKDLKLRSSSERLANFILKQQELSGRIQHFDLGIEKKRLASLLDMTPENLSRAFKGLQRFGVQVDGAKITIADQQDIERFAKPDPLIDDDTT